MTAFFIATSQIKDPQKFARYGQQAASTLSEFQGELVIKGKFSEALAGTAEHDAVGVIKFPTMDALQNWYKSDNYQALIPLREEAVNMSISTYAVPA
ncbi:MULTISPECIES: DUF1330 domain-containing protein [unclassified Agarivorans]|uniref:DUF1330 domain-containing protein n=1 Tax=unclassified Agarivorans TaxID=2636026 RepID=UPI0026E2F1D5|nr:MULTISPECIES: DUF1330 domain-containing protein [unclassified Agarivorans]MDO6687028.1 DUF1330 domain-containing protein [Agarivorans sp. 3_MG-2023]MDO6713560.1 DUF1330 domain-containing protein [Agarivorans sp. 2_MG-2023]